MRGHSPLVSKGAVGLLQRVAHMNAHSLHQGLPLPRLPGARRHSEVQFTSRTMGASH